MPKTEEELLRTEEIVNLFEKFKLIYRSNFVITNEAMFLDLLEIWEYALEGVSAEQIKLAYKDIVKGITHFNTFPPTPQDFRLLAINHKEIFSAFSVYDLKKSDLAYGKEFLKKTRLELQTVLECAHGMEEEEKPPISQPFQDLGYR